MNIAWNAMHNGKIPEMALTVSTNINSLRQLLYRAYVFGMFKAMFKRINYDTMHDISIFFDFQPLYFNKYLEHELRPSIDRELSLLSRTWNFKQMHGRVVKFTSWGSSWATEIDDEPVKQIDEVRALEIFQMLDEVVFAADQELIAHKKYMHCLALEAKGMTSSYEVAWKNTWDQKRVSQEKARYVAMTEENWEDYTFVYRPQAYSTFERESRVRNACEVQRRLVRAMDMEYDSPDDVDYNF